MILIGARLSSPRINRVSTGKSGSLPWLHQRNTPGRCISSGNFCTTIRARFRSSPTTHFPLARPITFGHDFTVITLRRRAIRRGGDANQSANGCPRFQWMIPNSARFWRRWIGWISGEFEESLTIRSQKVRDVYRLAYSLDMTNGKLASAILYFARSQFLASPNIELTGRENRNVFYNNGTFRDPKIRNAGFIQASAQLIHFDWLRGQEQQRFAFCFIRVLHKWRSGARFLPNQAQQ